MEKRIGNSDNYYIDRILVFCQRLIWQPIVEIAYGISSKSINWFGCLVPGLIFNVLVLTGADKYVWKFLRLGWMLPPVKVWPFFIYSVWGALIGFSAWSLWQTLLFFRMSHRLTEVFQTSGLKNAIGKLPSFVFDKPIDEFTRRMRLTRANLPVSQFISAKDNLESALQIYIDEIKEDRERGTVDIIYAGSAIPSTVKLTEISKIGQSKFLIGNTRARKIIADLRETPHFLVGGQSGGGKSTFLRQLITTLYLNNKNYEFVLIDLKGGLEFQLFEGIKRMDIVQSAKAALERLQVLDEILQERMAILKEHGCKDLEAYLDLPKEKRDKTGNIDRKVVVIDEAAELFMAGDKSGANNAQNAKRLTIKLAAQGRAVGIHLIIATQRPDVKAVDGQIKANLSGIVAFQMPNMHSSQTILDNSRAAHLPRIPGRCIWKTSLEQIEVQTPFLSTDDTTALLKAEQEKKNEG